MLTRLVSVFATAARSVSAAPAYSITVIATLSVAIGAAATLVAITDAVVLRPLPFAAPHELVTLWESNPQAGYPKFRVAAGNFVDWSADHETFAGMALFGSSMRQLSGDGEPEQLLGGAVSGLYFNVLGVRPQLGRVLHVSDARPGAAPVAVIPDALWARRYGRRGDVIGRLMRLDGIAYTIVGVAPRGIYPTWPRTTGGIEWGARYQDLWTPLVADPELVAARRAHVFGVVARLRPGMTLERAQRGLDVIAERLAREAPATNANVGVLVTRLADEVSNDVRPALFVLLGAVGLVMLAACATLTNLGLVRAASRQRELAVRASLGATRGRLARAVIGEHLTFALIGGVIGTVLARGSLSFVLALAPEEMPRAGEAHVDAVVFGFVLLLLIVTALVVAAVPTWQAVRIDPGDALRTSSRGGAGAANAGRLRRLLVALEVATAVVLLVGGVLAARSFAALTRVDLGFSSARVLAFELLLPANTYAGADRVAQFQERVLASLRSTPGVRSAAIGYDLPLEATWVDSFTIVGRATRDGEPASALLKIASPGYFATLGVDLLAGRGFTDDDRLGRPGVAVINNALARRDFGGDNPLGKRLSTGVTAAMQPGAATTYEIVGIVRDVHSGGVDASAPPAFYLPSAQFPQHTMVVFAATVDSPIAALGAVRAGVGRVDAQLPITNVITLESHVAAALARPRFILTVLAAFGLTVFVLAALGIYGFMSYAVAERRVELAVRLAVGASPGRLARLVIGEGGLLAALGVTAGLIAAAVAARLLHAIWFGVDALDPFTFGVVLVVVASAAAGASVPAALRASRIDPASALKG